MNADCRLNTKPNKKSYHWYPKNNSRVLDHGA